MCGYVGFADGRAPEVKKRILKPMTDRIAHRGPDMEGAYADEAVGLGFRRLSIIDLSADAAQPMLNEDGSAALVFNGEIYNFMQLRAQLIGKGHVFRCKADSEVLLHGYEEWGEGVVRRLRGMFSFALWDKKNARILLARDHFGIKPLYYAALRGGGFIFGSEIKSFLDHPDFEKKLNRGALRPYLSFQYAAGDETFFAGVFSLPPGHTAVWSGGALRRESYFDADFAGEGGELSFEDCRDAIDAAVRESVQAHRISDVPVGSFLSGGVDSSYITACLRPENSFSVGFGQHRFNETDEAAALSGLLGVRNFRELIGPEECFAAFPDIQYHMDLPQANPSCVPLWFLAKLARREVTVVLSGEGADELFAGYELYADTPAMRRFKRLPAALRRMLGRLAKAMPAFKGRNFLLKCSGTPEDWFIGQADVFGRRQALRVLQPACRKGDAPLRVAAPYYAHSRGRPEVSRKQYLDMHLWLPGDILLKADKMCMAHSLELRVPFLDREVMALAARVPARYNIRGTENKAVFRAAANKTLPNEWAARPKKGFPVPIRHWLREERYCNIVREYFESDFAAEFFRTGSIMRLLRAHYEGRAQNARRIWVIFTFLVWYKRFFIDWRGPAAAPAAEG